jgi:hypothetical protein
VSARAGHHIGGRWLDLLKGVAPGAVVLVDVPRPVEARFAIALTPTAESETGPTLIHYWR